MSRIQAFKAFVKTKPMELDLAMAEVYRELLAGRSGFALFDGGAHKGWHTLAMLKVPGCASVWAVEADPTIGALLAESLAKWHRAARPELHLIRKALQDRPEVTEIPWMSSHSHVGRSSIRAANAEVPSIWADHPKVQYRPPTTVPATTIDLILTAEPRPLPFVKLDLEGADILALRGAEATLTKRRPLVAFENSNRAPEVHGYTLTEVEAYFARLGYGLRNYVGEPLEQETWFSFHEAWAVPTEQDAAVRAMIGRAIARRIGPDGGA